MARPCGTTRHPTCRLAVAFGALLALAGSVTGCGTAPVRVQSLYLRTAHVGLFVDDEGNGGYLVEFQPIRKVPPLSELEVSFDRPGGSRWVVRMTVEPGRRRYDFASPVFSGFDRERDYFVRATLLDADRVTVLDRILQRVRATPAGERPVDAVQPSSAAASRATRKSTTSSRSS